jgi:uncharacterized protein
MKPAPYAPWQQEALDNRTLFLIILPTERCNFRCTYCYEDFEKGRMSRETVVALKRFLARRMPKLDRLHVEWFGGEPLISADIVRDVASLAKTLAENNSCAFTSSMTTNGFLLDRHMVRALCFAGVSRYQITLDGVGAVHDETRRRAGKSASSFLTIWRNLQYIRDSSIPVSVLIRLHITSTGQNCIEKAVDAISAEFLADSRFSIAIRPIVDMGGDVKDIPDPMPKEYIDALLRRAYGSAPGRLLDSVPQPYICYAAKSNSLIVRSDGSLSKCTVMLNDDANKIGWLTMDGQIEFDSAKLKSWIVPSLAGDVDVAQCPAKIMPRQARVRFVQMRRLAVASE